MRGPSGASAELWSSLVMQKPAEGSPAKGGCMSSTNGGMFPGSFAGLRLASVAATLGDIHALPLHSATTQCTVTGREYKPRCRKSGTAGAMRALGELSCVQNHQIHHDRFSQALVGLMCASREQHANRHWG